MKNQAMLRQIADELDDEAESQPCSESCICRDAADELGRLRAALEPLAELPVGAELFENDEYLDTILYKNGGKAITARDVIRARLVIKD